MDKWGPRPPWHMYRPPHKTVYHEKPDGTVVEVSDKFIEIRRKGDEGTVKYPPHFLLATGRVVVWENDSKGYLLEDVKKGDEVTLCVGTEANEKGVECFWVKITRRPGGVIPASRKPSDVHPYHVEQQAKIDNAEKGTPLPENLQPLPPVKALKPVVPAKPMEEPKKDDPKAKPVDKK